MMNWWRRRNRLTSVVFLAVFSHLLLACGLLSTPATNTPHTHTRSESYRGSYPG